MKKINIILSIMILLSNTIAIYASDDEENYDREQIKEQFNVEELSRKFNVNPEELTDSIIHDLNSDRFSPFSNIETPDTNSENSDISLLFEYSASNQDSTAYLATGNPGASGNMPWIGSCAVHNGGSVGTAPIIPFGTTIHYLNKTVNIGGKNYSSFVVNDTGDLQRRKSLYWTDLYFGANTSANYSAALNYGNQKVNIYWIR